MNVEELMRQLSEGGINVQGDFVMNKTVENEIGNVEAGGIGIQIVNGKEGTRKQTEDGEMGGEAPQPLSTDERIKQALDFIIADGAIVNKYDYAMIMMILEQELKVSFDNAQSFVNYLSNINVKHKDPNSDSINKVINKTKNRYPDWNWDGLDHNEVVRRNNIAKRFISAYNKIGK